MSLSAYARDRLFGANTKPCKTRGKTPVKDHVKLSGILRRLGQLNLTQDFTSNDLPPEQYRNFQRACADIAAMRWIFGGAVDEAMIMVGNQRGGARDLARHLMKQENERVEIHEVRGASSPAIWKARSSKSRPSARAQNSNSISIRCR
ncbi:MAG: hypothetical protein ACFB03_12070 [Paracoccaceae bacterium]